MGDSCSATIVDDGGESKVKRLLVVGLGVPNWNGCGLRACVTGGDSVTLAMKNSELESPSFDRLARLLHVKSKSTGYWIVCRLGSRGR